MNDAFVPQPIDAEDRIAWSEDAMHEAATICSRWGINLYAVIGTAEIPAGGLSEDALHRVGCLIGVDRALVVIFGEAQAIEWLGRENAGAAFGSRSPASIMLQDGLDGLLRVRGVLDAMKCGIFAPAAHDPDRPQMKFRVAPA